MNLATLFIGPDSDRLKAESLEAHRAGDTDKAVDLLAEAKRRDLEYARALRTLDN